MDVRLDWLLRMVAYSESWKVDRKISGRDMIFHGEYRFDIETDRIDGYRVKSDKDIFR